MNDNINKLLAGLSKQLGVSENQIKSAAQSGKVEEMLKNADTQQSEKIQAVLSDPQKAKEILNSPQAQALLKLLGDNK